MKVSLDTNVLLRLMVGDDEAQQQRAVETLEGAELVAISVLALCEFAWVLDRLYGARRSDISASIRRVLDMRNVVANRPAIEAGLSVLDAGGDFADGVIAYDGQWARRRDVRVVRQEGREAAGRAGGRRPAAGVTKGSAHEGRDIRKCLEWPV